MNPASHYKRRNYFINKEFQGRTIFNYFLLLALGSLVFVAIFSFFSSNTLSIVYENYQLRLGTTPGILFKKILSTQWLFIVLGGLAVVFVTLHLTHRVAGPFYRFEKSLDQMIGRDISNTIVLRQKDEGKSLAEKINIFNAALSEQLTLIEDHNAKIAKAIESLEKDLSLRKEGEPDNDPADISRLIRIIKESQNAIATEVNTYNLTSEPRD